MSNPTNRSENLGSIRFLLLSAWLGFLMAPADPVAEAVVAWGGNGIGQTDVPAAAQSEWWRFLRERLTRWP